jgi:hypothetical protein
MVIAQATIGKPISGWTPDFNGDDLNRVQFETRSLVLAYPVDAYTH